MRSFTHHVVFSVAIILSAFLILDRIEEKSPTEDEWAHLVRGLRIWHGDDFRLQYAHPPLANAITAAPLARDKDVPDFSTLGGWRTATVGHVVYSYLRSDYEGARAKLVRARKANVGFALMGVIYACFWGRSVLGKREGLLLGLVLAFHPTFAALARYVSSDLACGVLCFVATAEFVRHLRGDAPGATWFGVPCALSLAVLAKHSALLLCPLFAAISVSCAIGRYGRYSSFRNIRGSLRASIGYSAAGGLVVLFSINAAYGFQMTGLSRLGEMKWEKAGMEEYAGGPEMAAGAQGSAGEQQRGVERS